MKPFPRSSLTPFLFLLLGFLSACTFHQGSETNPVASLPGTNMTTNPVTSAIQGAHQTYNVGPGQALSDLDQVPWASLVAGDVVNIFAKTSAYRWKIGLRCRGTATAPIVINGVTDPSGRRPVLDFEGAKTAPGCNPGNGNDIFVSRDNEALGGIVSLRGPNDDYNTYEPGFFQIKNLELIGASGKNSFTALDGTTTKYQGGAGGVFLVRAEDVLLENLVIHDNDFGIFTMAKGLYLFEACKRVTVRSCQVYDNDVIGDQWTHNFYIQCVNPVIEGNYIGQVKAGAQGSSYKSRSSGEIFRYNYVVGSARAIDWVHSEDQDQGMALLPDYGTDYAYGNVIVDDYHTGNFASGLIHFGGDNLGEVYPGFTPDPTQTTIYRKHLYFWNNTVAIHATLAQTNKLWIFDLSLTDTTVDAWNNVFAVDSDGEVPPVVSWLHYTGVLNFRGNNLAFGTFQDTGPTGDPYVTNAPQYQIANSGTLVTGDPSFADFAAGNFRLRMGSAAIDQASETPTGVPAAITTSYPLENQPLGTATSGWIPRKKTGNRFDLGALEYQ